jgi:polar amino acid transport system substrate-binding protein
MINLIQNACQALPDNNRGIYISTAYDQNNSNIVVTIRDEGVGMPPETVEHIMDPFFTTKHDAGGIGLGLSISSRIVEEHGGTLRFSSEPGAGTTATITLPIEREKQTLEGNPE